MPYVTFVGKKRFIASYQLSGPTVMGRSLDCDVFIPDVFVSRRHCRIFHTAEGWVAEDLESRNGLHLGGQRTPRVVLKQDTIVEMGTVAFVFDEGDLPRGTSTPAPFGFGSVTELVDTVFAADMRPALFARNNCRKPLWLPAPLGDDDEFVDLPLVRVDPRPQGLFEEEWAELDIEWQVTKVINEMDLPPEEGWTTTESEEAGAPATGVRWPARRLPPASPQRRIGHSGEGTEESSTALLARPRPVRRPPSASVDHDPDETYAVDHSSKWEQSKGLATQPARRPFKGHLYAGEEEVDAPPVANAASAKPAKKAKALPAPAPRFADGRSLFARARDALNAAPSKLLEAMVGKPIHSAVVGCLLVAVVVSMVWLNVSKHSYHRPPVKTLSADDIAAQGN